LLKNCKHKGQKENLSKPEVKSMVLFKQDAEEICRIKGLEYPTLASEQVIVYFYKRLASYTWS